MTDFWWTDEAIARLTKLWSQTAPVLSTRAIGARMGISKNATVGKVHRLGLPPRASPIKGRAPTAKILALKATGLTNRAIGLLVGITESGVSEKIRQHRAGITPRVYRLPSMEAPVVLTLKPVAVAVVAPVVKPKAYAPAIGGPCCWPIGEPGTKTFRYCDDASLFGKSYCSSHCQIAYVSVRDRREAAA